MGRPLNESCFSLAPPNTYLKGRALLPHTNTRVKESFLFLPPAHQLNSSSPLFPVRWLQIRVNDSSHLFQSPSRYGQQPPGVGWHGLKATAGSSRLISEASPRLARAAPTPRSPLSAPSNPCLPACLLLARQKRVSPHGESWDEHWVANLSMPPLP